MKSFIIVVAGFAALLAYSVLFAFSFKDSGYKEGLENGYQRSSHFTQRYYDCFGKPPSEYALYNFKHFVDEPYTKSCEWLKSFDPSMEADKYNNLTSPLTDYGEGMISVQGPSGMQCYLPKSKIGFSQLYRNKQ